MIENSISKNVQAAANTIKNQKFKMFEDSILKNVQAAANYNKTPETQNV